jgi:hypothetical protein
MRSCHWFLLAVWAVPDQRICLVSSCIRFQRTHSVIFQPHTSCWIDIEPLSWSSFIWGEFDHSEKNLLPSRTIFSSQRPRCITLPPREGQLCFGCLSILLGPGLQWIVNISNLQTYTKKGSRGQRWDLKFSRLEPDRGMSWPIPRIALFNPHK